MRPRDLGRALGAALALAFGACAPPAPPPAVAPQPWFSDQAAAAGLDVVVWCGASRDEKSAILESIGQGAAFLDDDGDGHLDLFVVNGSSLTGLPDPPPTNRYFASRRDGTYADESAAAGVAEPAWGNGVAAADCDNDGDSDLFVTSFGPHRLYQGQGAQGSPRRFREVAHAAGVACDEERRMWGSGCAWGDVDGDGHLDLYVCHYLWFDPQNPPNGGRTVTWMGIRDAYYGPIGCVPQADRLFRNRGDGTFGDHGVASRVALVEPAYSLGVIFSDVDLDGDADIYVANDSMPNYLFVNDGSGRFDERAGALGLAYGEQGNAQAGMGLDAADWNGDGRDELLVTNFDGDVSTLYENAERGFRDITVRVGLAQPTRNRLSWGCALVDFDHDGDRDVFIANGHVYPRAEVDAPSSRYLQPNTLLETRDGRLFDATERAGPAFAVRETSRGVAFGDYDADGDVDAFVSNLNARPTLYRNDTRDAGSWIQVRLIGSASNRDGIGARVTVVALGREQSAERRAGASYLSTSSPWMHFGLGSAERVEEIRVRWPSGRLGKRGPLAARAFVVIEE